MAFIGSNFLFHSIIPSSLALAALGLGLSGLAGPALAQAPLRCDLEMSSTPGAGAATACLDLVALQNGGTPIQTANNATRISTDGFRMCKNAFATATPAGADIVFIYDNSGSMYPTYAFVDIATNDTTFYHKNLCNSGGTPATNGTITYNMLTGPRTVGLLTTKPNCNGSNPFAGDPYNARGKVMAQGIDYLVASSPNSTAGAVAFNDTTNYERPPLLVSGPGNAALVKNSIVLDTTGATYYKQPLDTARNWLNNPALINTAKKAIIFISDGVPNDGANGPNGYTAAAGGIPVYGIFLGGANSTAGGPLQTLSTVTGGIYYQVDPDNIAQMNQVMQQIIQAITVVNLPTAIEVTNNSFAPPMVSRSTGLSRNPDSSISLVLDSIIALKLGANSLSVKVTMNSSDVRTYPVTVQADGPAAGATTQQLTCHPMPTLALLNQSGGIDSVYPPGTTQYDVRLTRSASDLEQVVVNAVSKDTSRGAAWGDQESLVLPQISSTGGLTTNRRENQNFNGGSVNPGRNNGTLEGAPNGEVILTWTHPRDARETATFTLPGKKIPVAPGFIDMIRVSDVPKGVTITTPVTNPIVIRGGVTLGQNNQGATLVHKGVLFNPHNISDALLNPNNTPTFIFKTAAPFEYQVSIFDHLGQFLCSQNGKVDSARWEQMRAGSDSLAVAFSILPVAESGQPFGTGVYIMKATLKTNEANRLDPGRPMRVTPATRIAINRFGYRR